MRQHRLFSYCVGGEMLLRVTTITILIGLAGPGSNGYAQSYSGRHYLPSQEFPDRRNNRRGTVRPRVIVVPISPRSST